MFSSNRKRLAVACLCVGVAGASAWIAPAVAQDMAKPMMGHDDMAKDGMMKMKAGMTDDASKMQMTSDLAKTMAMHQMAMSMAMDPKSQKMLNDDTDTKKIIDDASKMAADPAMKDKIMSDPEAMKQVMLMTMAASAMMKDKMGMGGMDHGKMMDHGMTGHDEKMGK